MTQADKWTHPREAALEAVIERIEERVLTISGGDLDGMGVVTIGNIKEAFREPLPPISEYTAEVVTPALVYVAGVCPRCSERTNLRIDLGTELRVDPSGSHLRLKGKTKEVTHWCGQRTLDSEVDGQQTFDLDLLKEGDAVQPEALRDLLLLVDSEYPADLPSIETIEGWTEPVREAVAAWAGAIYLRASDNNEVEIPEMPEVLAEVNAVEEEGEGDGSGGTPDPD